MARVGQAIGLTQIALGLRSSARVDDLSSGSGCLGLPAGRSDYRKTRWRSDDRITGRRSSAAGRRFGFTYGWLPWLGLELGRAAGWLRLLMGWVPWCLASTWVGWVPLQVVAHSVGPQHLVSDWPDPETESPGLGLPPPLSSPLVWKFLNFCVWVRNGAEQATVCWKVTGGGGC